MGKNMCDVFACADLLVAGGGFKGIAAAKTAADAGMSVILTEPLIMPGFEITAWQRPWLAYDPAVMDPVYRNITGSAFGAEDYMRMAEYWFPIDGRTGFMIPLHMDKLKIRLEDILINSGVKIFYACRPVRAEASEPAGIYGKSGLEVTIAGKTGVQVIKCTDFIDTLRIRNSRSLGCNSNKPFVFRTIEFTGVDPDMLNESLCTKISAKMNTDTSSLTGLYPNNSLQIDDYNAYVYPGAYSESHFFIETECSSSNLEKYCLGYCPGRTGMPMKNDSYPSIPDMLKKDAAEDHYMRRRSLEAAEWLINNNKAFRDAEIGLGSLVVRRTSDFCEADPLACILQGIKSVESLISGHAADANHAADTEHAAGKNHNVEYAAETTSTDVFVAGGGTSGAMAAYAASGRGVKTIVAEMNPCLGGTGTIGGVDSYWYGIDNVFSREIDGRMKIWSDRLKWHSDKVWSTEIRAFVLLDMCLSTKADVILSSPIFDAAGGCAGEEQATGSSAMKAKHCGSVKLATPYGILEVMSTIIIDATGDGDVAVMAGAGYLYGNERDCVPMWSSLPAYNKPGRTVNNFLCAADVSDLADYTRFILAARRKGDKLYDHGAYVAPRETRHISGKIWLTLEDQLMMRKFPDTVLICFSNHDVKGVSIDDIIRFGILPYNVMIEVPYRAMLPEGIKGMIIAGKAVSASHEASAGIRMQRDIQQMGGVAGLAAAYCAEKGILPDELPVREFQIMLVKAGMLPAEIPERDAGRNVTAGIASEPLSEAALELTAESSSEERLLSLVAGLTGDEKFEFWIRGDKSAYTAIPPVVEICMAPSEKAIPLLLAEYAASASMAFPKRGKKRLILARLLAWHRSDIGADDLIDAIRCNIRETNIGNITLPGRAGMHGSILPGQTILHGSVLPGHMGMYEGALPGRTGPLWGSIPPPNHGVMPETVYLLNAVARTGSHKTTEIIAEITELICSAERDYANPSQGIFYYIQNIAFIAEDLSCKPFAGEFVPLLEKLLSLGELQDYVWTEGFDIDTLAERKSYLVLCLARALFSCGSEKGRNVLLKLLTDNRSLLAKSAERAIHNYRKNHD